MRQRDSSRRWAYATLLVGAIAVVAGCSAILGVGDYVVADADGGGGDGGGGDASIDAPESAVDAGSDADAGPACNVDLSLQCYPCVPTTTEQFLNGCSDGTCVPFDRDRLKGLLLPDGTLPPLPDGG
jgi:hypothetical protein